MRNGDRLLTAGKLIAAVLVFSSVSTLSSSRGETANFTAPGRVEGAAPAMAIGAAVTGIVNEILVHQGSRVEAGQLLFKLDCRAVEADLRARKARLAAAQATYDRFRNGPRPDEIAVGEAVVGYSQARADEAQKTLQRTLALQEGVTVTAARILEVQRDARIAAAQLEEAKARLSLLRAGSREEDLRQAKALRDAAAADFDDARARLDQCAVHAPVAGTVLDVSVNQGELVSLAVPRALLHILPAGPLRILAAVALSDLPQLCPQQHASITSDIFPNANIPAQVDLIGAEVTEPRSGTGGAAPTTDVRKDVIEVVLTLDGSPPTMPIGLLVAVHFQACASKT